MLKKILGLNIFISLFCLLGCTKKDADGYRIYEIKKGNHRSVNKISYVKTNTISFDLILTESCKYETELEENQLDVNKVFGASDGKSHLKNSARIGWRYVDGNLELMAYTRVNGEIQFKKICNAIPDEVYNCQINFNLDCYQFIVNGEEVLMDRYWYYVGPRYLLYPYFGGDEVAPHDMVIKIKK